MNIGWRMESISFNQILNLDESMNRRIDESTHERTNARTHERTNARIAPRLGTRGGGPRPREIRQDEACLLSSASHTLVVILKDTPRPGGFPENPARNPDS